MLLRYPVAKKSIRKHALRSALRENLVCYTYGLRHVREHMGSAYLPSLLPSKQDLGGGHLSQHKYHRFGSCASWMSCSDTNLFRKLGRDTYTVRCFCLCHIQQCPESYCVPVWHIVLGCQSNDAALRLAKKLLVTIAQLSKAQYHWPLHDVGQSMTSCNDCRILSLVVEAEPEALEPLESAATIIQKHWRGVKVYKLENISLAA